MSQLKRFFSYYKPYRGLFVLDMVAATASSLLSIFFPALTRELLKTWIPEGMWTQIITCFAMMFSVYVIQSMDLTSLMP